MKYIPCLIEEHASFFAHSPNKCFQRRWFSLQKPSQHIRIPYQSPLIVILEHLDQIFNVYSTQRTYSSRNLRESPVANLFFFSLHITIQHAAKYLCNLNM